MWLWFWDFIRETDLIWFECESAFKQAVCPEKNGFHQAQTAALIIKKSLILLKMWSRDSTGPVTPTHQHELGQVRDVTPRSALNVHCKILKSQFNQQLLHFAAGFLG